MSYDVFLSHNSKDKPYVRAVCEWLKRHGVNPWLDEANLEPGDRLTKELGEAMEASRAAVVFIGPNGEGPWQGEEIDSLLNRAIRLSRQKDEFRIIPVLLPNADTAHLRNNSKYLLNCGLRAKLEIAGLLISGILWNLLMILPIPIVGALAVLWLNKWDAWGAALASGQAPWPGLESVAGFGLKYSAGLLAILWPLLPLIQLLTHGRKPGSFGAVLRRVWERATLGVGVLMCLAGVFYLLPAAFHGYEWIRDRLSGANIGWLKSLPDWGTASVAGAGSVLLGFFSAWLKPHWPKLRAVVVKLFILSGPLLFLWVFLLVGNRLGLASQADQGWVAVVPWVALGLMVWGCPFELDNNILGYADSQAVLTYDRKRLKILNNVFTHNRFANLTDLDKVVVNDKSMDLLRELGFGAVGGNVVLDPQMSFDKKWWAEYSREDGPRFFARPYDWREALNLLPQNPECKAGARPVKLEVHFNP